jgi:hypothetical protein
MNFGIRWLFLLSAVLLAVPAAQAQIQFTRADIEPTLTDRDMTIYSTIELSGVTFNLGSAGAGQVYDFSGFTFEQSTYQSVFVAPAVTPYASDYPTATHAQIFMAGEAAYSYMRLDDNGFYDLGFATEYSGSEYILKYDPEMPSLLFPLQLGSAWTYSGTEVVPLEGFYEKTDMEIEAVSEGMLVTPYGSWPALCVRNRTWVTQRIEFGGMVISEEKTQDVNYMFLTKQGVGASLSVDTLDALSWTPRIDAASLNIDGSTNAVGTPAHAASLGIESVYPHPVSGGSTLVTWRADGNASLTVHDNTGRELRRISQEAHPGVTQQTQLILRGLAPGMYFLRLHTNSGVTQRPVMLLR